MSDEAVETPEAPAEAKETKPVVEVDEYEELLKKKPIKYKAGGKEKTITSAKDLYQHLSRVSGVDAAASEALKAKQEAAALKAQKDGIKKLRGAERARAMAEFFEEDPVALREAFAEDILADDEKRQERAKLSERERQMADELEKYKSEHARMQEAYEAHEREKEEQALTARVQEVGARLEKVAVGALQKAKIAPEHAPKFLRPIADRFTRNEGLGLELDEDEVAQVVMEEHGQLADTFYSSLEVPALAERLGAQMVDDPSKPGEKVSKLRLLMRHEAARIKAQAGGSVAMATNGAAQRPAAAKPMSDIEKMAFWRSR